MENLKYYKKLNLQNNYVKNQTFLLIDICGTYVKENTTIGLLENHFSKLSIKGLLIRCFIYKFSPLRNFILLIEKFTRSQILKNLLIFFIKGVSVKSLEITAFNYANKLLKSKRNDNPEVINFIRKHISKSKPIFISASLEPIVKAISLIEDIPYVASKMEYINNLYTGRLKSDITGLKKNELMNKFNIDLNKAKYYLITDNIEDLSLSEKSLETLFITKKKNNFFINNFTNKKNIKFVFF